ncbi:MAG: hypothetical protein HYY84_14335 [Deltaproteobacteria bacterium]|nr:hypothetical protein [Deltaproteobacteria bacterium]
MDEMLLRIFQTEVERQARFGLVAAADLKKAITSGDKDRIWYSIQSLLIAVGNVSKLFWPSRPEMLKRGGDLRTCLGVPDLSPLNPRTLRNHFEHFDERLEQWATSSHRKNFVDSNVGPTGMISGLDPGDHLRNFDTTKWAVTFAGDECSLKPVVDELRKVAENARRALAPSRNHSR